MEGCLDLPKASWLVGDSDGDSEGDWLELHFPYLALAQAQFLESTWACFLELAHFQVLEQVSVQAQVL